MRKFVYPLILLVFCAGLVACSANVSPNNYSPYQVGVAGKTVAGVVISRRVVNITGNSGVGVVAGSFAGSSAGSFIGGSLAANLLGAVGGAVIGGLVGNAIDKSVHHQLAYEYIIKLRNGSSVGVTQSKEIQFNVGQHVLVVYGPMTRVIPDTSGGRVK